MFCHLLHGRNENTLATERIIGCCVTEVPLRVKLDTSMAGKVLLDQVQQQVHSSMPQPFGVPHHRRVLRRLATG
jgi:hypothetical protein